MYKFKISKYKNAVGKIWKKEDWITDLSVGAAGLQGNQITASAAFVAFHVVETGNEALGILPLDFKGRFQSRGSLLRCHSDKITDFVFSPFDDGLLATGSHDCTVKLWRIPKEGLHATNILNPEITLSEQLGKIETLAFHPSADHVLTLTSHSILKLWDLTEQKEIYCFSEQEELIQSMSWRDNGSTIATASKDKQLRIIDPRSDTVQVTAGHGNMKDVRVRWLGDSERILSTGFDSSRHRQLLIHDIRNFTQPLKTMMFDSNSGILLPFFDPDTKMLFIVGKGDASVTFLEITENDPYVAEALKHFMEAPTRGACLVPKRAMNVMQAEVNRLLQLTPSAIVPISYQVPRKSYYDFHSDLFPDTDSAEPALGLSEWLSGITKNRKKISMNPKHSKASLVRFCDTTKDGNNKDSDMVADEVKLHPEITQDNSQEMEISDKQPKLIDNVISWESSQVSSTGNKDIKLLHQMQTSGPNETPKKQTEKPFPLPKPSMSPVMRKRKSFEMPSEKLSVQRSPASSVSEDAFTSESASDKDDGNNSTASSVNGAVQHVESFDSKDNVSRKAEMIKKLLISDEEQNSSRKGSEDDIKSSTDNFRRTPSRRGSGSFKPFAGFRTSKFRHLKGTAQHESQHITNLSDFNTSLPGECDGIHANKKRIAVPLKGIGGRIAILELSKPGRLPDGLLPVIQNGSNVLDFCWDPFDDSCLAVACDDGTIRLWTIPSGGLVQSKDKPDKIVQGLNEKICIIKFHPLAQDIFITASHHFCVRLWSLKDSEEKFKFQGHKDKIFGIAWSPDGKYFATVCKDKKIRIFNPRMSCDAIQEGPGPSGTRGARIAWVVQGKFILVAGFDKVCERLVNMYNTEDISSVVTSIQLDTSPSILVPYYDEDSNTVFLTGKGDSTIYAYETIDETPYLFPLSHHKCPNVHQGLSLLPKLVCNVRNVEFARVLRLVGTVVEPIAFTVPRIKIEFFQDDLFPDSRVSWEPTMSAEEWLGGMNKNPKRISWMPEGMSPVTGKGTPVTSTRALIATDKEKPMSEMSTKEKESELAKAISSRIGFSTTLPQDEMEGVDPDEWE